MKIIRMSFDQWSVFYGALVGLKMPGVTGAMFYKMSPLVQEAVTAILNAEDDGLDEGVVIDMEKK